MPKRSRFKFSTDELALTVTPKHIDALVEVLRRSGVEIESLSDNGRKAREKIYVVLDTAACGTLTYQAIIEDPAEWAHVGKTRSPGPPLAEALGSFLLRMAALFREFVPDAPEPYLHGASQKPVGPILDFIQCAVTVLGFPGKDSERLALLKQYQRARKRRENAKG